jgi:hypothetical protein
VCLQVEKGEQFEFLNKVVGTNIPPEYIPSCEKGAKDAMDKGPLTGHPAQVGRHARRQAKQCLGAWLLGCTPRGSRAPSLRCGSGRARGADGRAGARCGQ